MQWAIRSRDSHRSSGVRLGGGSNLVFIDPNALRRTTAANAAVAAASQEPPTMATTSSALARAFGIVIRQISELVALFPLHFGNTQIGDVYQEVVQLQKYVEQRLKPTWEWILTVMDATEAQLRFGASLTDSADPTNPLHPLNNPPGTSGIATSSLGISVLGSAQQRMRSAPVSAQSSLGATTRGIAYSENERGRDRDGKLKSKISQ